MTQHINLLSKSRTKKNSTWIALRGLLLLLLFFSIWSMYNELNLHNLKNSNDDLAHSLLELKKDFQNKNRASGVENAQALTKSSALMQKKLDAHRELLQVVKNGEIGSMQGHAQFFQSLATIPQNDVWLTEVDVSKAGQMVSISGMSLTTTSVMHYAEQLNQAFNAAGIAFSSLEISKEETSVSAATPPSNTMKFKLY